MSLLTANPLLCAPVRGAGASVVTPTAAAWTWGAWTQVLATVPSIASVAGIYFGVAGTSNKDAEVDVGIGLPGAEISLGMAMRFKCTAGSGGTGTYLLPQPLIGTLIPAGAAVSLRIRADSGTGDTYACKLLYYLLLDSDAISTWLPLGAPLAATAITVTPVSTAWLAGNWSPFTTGLANDVYLYGITFAPGGAASTPSDFEIDIGIGGAGTEVVITTLRHGTPSLRSGRLLYLNLPALLKVASSTRISARIRQASTFVSAFPMSLLYYDGPPGTPPPSPPSDYPCVIKEPVFWGTTSVAGSSLLFGKKPIRDPGTYYGGYKPPRALEISPITRQASDWGTGAWSAQEASVKLADTDGYYRGLFVSGQPDFKNSLLYLYLISEDNRLLGNSPSLLFNGPISDDALSEGRTITLTANDRISSDFNLYIDEPQIPQRYLSYGDFPSAGIIGPVSNRIGVPIIYGTVSDEGAATPIGRIQLIDVGTVIIGGTTYRMGLVCGHACTAGILNAYQDGALLTTWGTDIWAPGKAGWTTIQPSGALYYDINGNRYTIVFIDNSSAIATDFADGSKPIYVNVNGIETVGDGTGSCITKLLLQYKHLMVNWITQSYTSGPYLSGLTFPFYPGSLNVVNVVDQTSWDIADAVSATYLGSSYLGGFVLGANGQRQALRSVLQDGNISCNTVLSLDHLGQISIAMLDRRRTNFLASAATITARRDILSEPKFTIEKKMDWFFTNLAYQFKANYRQDGVPTLAGDTAGPFEITAEAQEDVIASSRYGLVTQQQDFSWIRDTATADMVAFQKLQFAKNPPRMATWAQSLCGLRRDVLTGVPITSYLGLGTNGWTNNAVWIMSQTIDPRAGKVIFTGIDVDALLS